jgi:hypothetical protein
VASLGFARAIDLSAILSVRSGSPYSVMTGRDPAGLFTFHDRGGRVRNSDVMNPAGNLAFHGHRRITLRLLGGIALDAGISADNLLNRVNVTKVGTVVGTPLFGRALGALPGRSARMWVTVTRRSGR